MKILLDYVFPITVITPTAAASTGFLKRVCLVCKPKSGQEGNVGTMFTCNSMTEVAARTDNTNAQQLFNAGLSQVFILLSEDLDLETAMTTYKGEFYTLLVSDDFDDADIELANASGTVTITAYASLVDTTPDTISVAGVTFTAQAGAATLGTATFQAATSDEATATSLAAQINAHATTKALVEATVDGDEVTITAKDAGTAGNDIAVAYTDNNSPSVGLTLGGLSGGKLAGGAGLLAGSFDGVIGVSSDDADFCAEQVTLSNRCAFFTKSANGAKNMCFAFGSLLANPSNWLNQQYITMPVNDDVDTLGEANSLFDDKVSFVINDDEYGNRLALFAVQGKAIVAPYILKNLRIDLQSRALQWISGNMPQYTLKEASLLETRLQEDVINAYIARKWIESGTVAITLEQQNFQASGDIEVPQPKAMWRVLGEMRETL